MGDDDPAAANAPGPAAVPSVSTSSSPPPPGSALVVRRPKRRSVAQSPTQTEDVPDEASSPSGAGSSSTSSSSSSSHSPATAENAGAASPAKWSLPFPAVPPRRQKKRRNRNGWGPFRSVVRERSVDFNLTLDVQQLQQEVQHLEAVRNALRFKSLNLRHAPDGSLMQTVREYFRLFRRGYCVRGDSPRLAGARNVDGLIRESEQRAFIFSVMDEALDCGNGLYGPQVMVEQISNYSTFLRYISFDLNSFDIVTVEDSVIVTTYATLRFQILRTTIAMIFPHVMGNEALVARLVGQELAPVGKITFYFNAKDKCERYVAELDFAGLFFDLLDDPRDVDILMGRALIADNSMFGINQPASATDHEPRSAVSHVEEPQDRMVFSAQPTSDSDLIREYYEDDSGYRDGGAVIEDPAPEPRYADAVYSQEQQRHQRIQDDNTAAHWMDQQAQRVPEQALAAAPNSGISSNVTQASEWGRPPAKSLRVSLASMVDEYFAVFAATSSVDNHGYVRPVGAAHEREQWEFLSSFLASDARCGGSRVGAQGLLRQWQTLRSVFRVAAFRQVAPNAAMYDPVDNSFVIRTVAEYRLQCTPRTIEAVFPHVPPQSAVGRLLLGQQLVVESDLAFYMAANAGKVTRVTERMGLVAAIASIVPDPEVRALLLSRARLTKDGQLAESLEGSRQDERVTHFSF